MTNIIQSAAMTDNTGPVCSMSWGGFNLHGDEKSIAKAKQMLHDSGVVGPLKDRICELQAALAAPSTPAAPIANGLRILHKAPAGQHPDCMHGCSHPARSLAGPCQEQCVKTREFQEQSSMEASAAQLRFSTEIGANVLTEAPQPAATQPAPSTPAAAKATWSTDAESGESYLIPAPGSRGLRE